MVERSFFAERLKALRMGAGLSQPALAGRSGVAVSTVRQFEYGLREPTFGTLVKLARGLDVSLAAFDVGATNQVSRRGIPTGKDQRDDEGLADRRGRRHTPASTSKSRDE